MNKKVILHIGASKTGTSALQSFFALNKASFFEHGFYYPDASSDKLAIEGKVTSGNGVQLALLLEADTLEKEMLEKLVYDYVKDAEGKNILISSERLHRFNVENMKIFFDLIRAQGYVLEIVFYVRAIVDKLVSSYAQQVKGAKYTKSLIDYVKKADIEYRRVIEKILSVSEEVLIQILNYDKVKLEHEKNFLLKVLGLRSIENFNVEKKIINRTLVPEEIEFMRFINNMLTSNAQTRFISNALLEGNGSLENREICLSQEVFDLVALRDMGNTDFVNEFLDEDNKLDIVDEVRVDEKVDIELDTFQQSVCSVLAALVARQIRM